MTETPTKRGVAAAAIALDLAALAVIVAAGPNGTFAPLDIAKPLNEAGLVEINPEVNDASGNIAVRATLEGIAKMDANTTAAPTAAVAPNKGFAIMAVPAEILSAPKAKRGRSAETYPFADLQVGQGFFIPKTADREDPAKSMASTVSSAVARYAVPAVNADGSPEMETVKVKTYQVDAEGKRVKVEGKFVVVSEADETRQKMTRTRVFELRSVTAPEAGAWVVRTA